MVNLTGISWWFYLIVTHNTLRTLEAKQAIWSNLQAVVYIGQPSLLSFISIVTPHIINPLNHFTQTP